MENKDQKIVKKNIAILGSTGSIGTQALEVITEQNQFFEVELLCAHSNADLLIQQVQIYKPNCVVLTTQEAYKKVKEVLWNSDTKVYFGIEALCDCLSMESIDIVLTAMVGYAGLQPTIAALKAGKKIALANKETLVVAGELISKLCAENRASIIPVDSEHSAIFQCLVGELDNPVEKIILTASGGPFRGYDLEKLSKVSKAQALKHPNWTMGAKITIDSATLMNKGLEVIEAKWLFGLNPNQIEVVVHPQSIVHSMVQFEDGSIKAQMGLPDMKLPIQYAFAYPKRVSNSYPRLNFADYPNLSFEKPNTEVFRNLDLAFWALKKGGNMPCALNAANEIAVEAFLKEKIDFLKIPNVIEKCLESVTFVSHPSYEDYVESDQQARKLAGQIISK